MDSNFETYTLSTPAKLQTVGMPVVDESVNLVTLVDNCDILSTRYLAVSFSLV